MDVVFPKIKVGVSGVYKYTIDDEYFYIGSSKNIIRRIYTHIDRLKSKMGNIWVRELLNKDIKSIRFEIVEIVEDNAQLKEREFYYIKENSNNLKLLNCVKSTGDMGIINATLKVTKYNDIINLCQLERRSFSNMVDILLGESVANRKLKTKK